MYKIYPFIDQTAVNAAINAASTFAPIEVDDAIMRTRAKANSTHAMEVYIPKQEKEHNKMRNTLNEKRKLNHNHTNQHLQ